MTIYIKLKQLFQVMLGWDLVKKSQILLIYAALMKFGLYLLVTFFLQHPVIDSHSAAKFQVFLLGSVFFNLMMVGVGFAVKRKLNWHEPYALLTMISYVLIMLSIPLMIGFLHIINGLLVTSIVMLSMVFFTNRISYIVEGLLVVGYGLIIGLTGLNYLDYGMLFQPHVLMNPLLVHAYLPISLFYMLFYILMTLLLLRLCNDNWKDKSRAKDIDQCTDHLTGLFNYRGLQQLAELKLRQAYLTDSELSVVVLDIDNFNRLSTQYGHQNRELILSHVAHVLRDSLRVSDMISRHDKDKFVLMLAFTSLNRAEHVAEMCRSALERSILQLNNRENITVKASFGISSTAGQHYDLTELLAEANAALSLAKENGKNQVCRLQQSPEL